MQIKVNTKKHDYPNTSLSDKIRPSTTKWIVAKVLDWVRHDLSIEPAKVRTKLSEKFNVLIPYHRVFNGKEMALDFILGNWTDCFHMLYSFKDEVEKISPGSVVDIDYEVVKGRENVSMGVKYKHADKKCFGRF